MSNGSIHLWTTPSDGAPARVLFRIEGHEMPVDYLAFSSDGERLVSSGVDDTVRVWSVKAVGSTLAAEQTGVFQAPKENKAALSPDGRYLAAGGAGKHIILWDLDAGRKIWTIEARFVTSLAFSGDGRRLAAGRYEDIRIFDVESRKMTAVCEGHDTFVISVAFSPEGRLLASGGADKTVRLWDLSSIAGESFKGTARDGVPEVGEVARLEHGSSVSVVSFSPDGRHLASAAGDHAVWYWDIFTDRPGTVLKGHAFVASALAFSSDGKRLISLGFDQSVRTWDLSRGEQIGAQSFSWNHFPLALSRDGTRLIAGDEDLLIRLWDLSRNQEIVYFDSHPGEAVVPYLSHDGRRILLANQWKGLRLWSEEPGQGWCVPKDEIPGVWTVAFSEDDRMVAAGGDDTRAYILDAETGRVLSTLDTPVGVSSISFSPDGKSLALAGYDFNVRLYDLDGGEQVAVMKGHQNRLGQLAFSPDGRLLATGCRDKIVRIWDLSRCKETKTAPGAPCELARVAGFTGLHKPYSGLAFSPDGRTLAVAQNDHTIHLVDISALELPAGELLERVAAESGLHLEGVKAVMDPEWIETRLKFRSMEETQELP